MSSFKVQVSALFKKSLIIYFHNKKSLFKDLLLPIITALFIISNDSKENQFLPIQFLFPISLLGHIRSILVDVVMDKSEKYKEYLLINGVTHSAYLSSVLIFAYFKCLLFTIITCSGFLFISGLSFEERINFFGMYFLVAVASSHFALLITTFFSNKELCADIGAFLYSILSFLYIAAIETGEPFWYYLSVVFPQNTLAFAVGKDQTENSFNFSTSAMYAYILFDGTIYFLLYMYFDQVLPNEYGIKKPWLFFITENCQRRQANFREESENVTMLDYEEYNQMIPEASQSDDSSALHHETFDNPENLAKTIDIKNISKVFGEEKAVDNLSMMIYEKQIFCLLGHNGAGKTTTINILTGLYRSTSGEVFYGNGEPFSTNFQKIRKTIGLCNQQDILYNDLTTRQHLELLGRIKGLDGRELEREIDSAIRKLNLTTEAHKTSKTMSGGNRRKLSLALAIIGNPKIIFLDEPTSGMDPNSRRFVWSIIKDLKNQGKTIVLTTHHLDEADELADRLGVMVKGKLFALGSSEFLKKQFGVGYHLSITPDYESTEKKEINEVAERIESIVKRHVAATSLTEHGSEHMKFLLPFSSQQGFSGLFKDLEKIKGIRINLQMNSLEDTFVNIGVKEDSLFQDADTNDLRLNLPSASDILVTPKYNFWAQLNAMFLRKYYSSIRSYTYLMMLGLPILFIVLGVYLASRQIDEVIDQTGQQSLAKTAGDFLLNFMFLLMVNFAYCLNSTVYASLPVFEREKKIKYVLKTMGCRTLPYWLGTFLFDLIAVSILTFAILALVYIFDLNQLEKKGGLLLLVTFLYSIAIITSGYMWGFAFNKASTVNKSYSAFYFFVLYTLPSVVITILNSLGFPESFIQLLRIVQYHLCPLFTFNDAVWYLLMGKMTVLTDDTAFFGSIEECIVFFVWLSAFYMIVTLYQEYRRSDISLNFSGVRESNGQEIDRIPEILSEMNRVKDSENKDPIKAIHIKKIYPNGCMAVKDITFGVAGGEIFGLLGPNGAGKSTAFSIITGMFRRTAGRIELNGVSIDNDLTEVQKEIGICPQFNSLWDNVLVGEHLAIFCKIKGIKGEKIKNCVYSIANSLQLQEHIHKRASILSGGTKRKLCAGISMLSNPSIIFLDEPSTGLDPLAKRYLWASLRRIALERKAAIILTTHSMEEAEELCTRVGIMINGKFVCLGPLNYLKNTYGSGYKITIAHPAKDLTQQIESWFAGVEKQEESSQAVTYRIPNESFVFSKAFEELEKLKQAFIISDYSIYNTSLEQVFIKFSKDQHERDNQSN